MEIWFDIYASEKHLDSMRGTKENRICLRCHSDSWTEEICASCGYQHSEKELVTSRNKFIEMVVKSKGL